eukprot:364709-Chlamydomonas_euryale.AAC.24
MHACKCNVPTCPWVCCDRHVWRLSVKGREREEVQDARRRKQHVPHESLPLAAMLFHACGGPGSAPHA